MRLTKEKLMSLITVRNICEVPLTKYYYGSVQESKCSFSCHLQIDKKNQNFIVNKNRSKRNN